MFSPETFEHDIKDPFLVSSVALIELESFLLDSLQERETRRHLETPAAHPPYLTPFVKHLLRDKKLKTLNGHASAICTSVDDWLRVRASEWQYTTPIFRLLPPSPHKFLLHKTPSFSPPRLLATSLVSRTSLFLFKFLLFFSFTERSNTPTPTPHNFPTSSPTNYWHIIHLNWVIPYLLIMAQRRGVCRMHNRARWIAWATGFWAI